MQYAKPEISIWSLCHHPIYALFQTGIDIHMLGPRD